MVSITNISNIFMSPQSIFFGPYLALAIIIIIVVMVMGYNMSPRAALRRFFSREIWLTKSAFTDVVVSVFYLLFFDAMIVSAQLVVSTSVYTTLKPILSQHYPQILQVVLNPVAEAVLASILVVTCFDFATYLSHRLMHSVPFLWDIHLVHHSPKHLNFFSAYRQHPFDRLIRNSLGGVFTAIGMTIFHVVLPTGSVSYSVFGMGIGFFLFMLTVNLQHSHVPVCYPKFLSWLLLSPHLHQIHHSAAAFHQGKNFGGIFPFWDRLCGTYHDEKVFVGSLKFGLTGLDPIGHSIFRCYFYPFYAIAGRLIKVSRTVFTRRSDPVGHR